MSTNGRNEKSRRDDPDNIATVETGADRNHAETGATKLAALLHARGYPPQGSLAFCYPARDQQTQGASVRETAALGNRRFVSVIQFESQRFLIGSSPTSVTLLAQLPDQPHHEKEPDEEAREETVEECGQPGEKEKTHRESEEKN